jgi:hypothetical protein
MSDLAGTVETPTRGRTSPQTLLTLIQTKFCEAFYSLCGYSFGSYGGRGAASYFYTSAAKFARYEHYYLSHSRCTAAAGAGV